MGRAEQIIDQLQKKPESKPGELSAVDGDIQFRLKLADWDRLGCLVEKVEMKCSNGHAFELDPVRIEKEVTYLGEPLRIIELEKYDGKATLRSYPPRMENGTVSFFEIILDRCGGLSLTRLSYDRNRGTRAPVPASFTRETLERLLSDLCSFIREN